MKLTRVAQSEAGEVSNTRTTSILTISRSSAYVANGNVQPIPTHFSYLLGRVMKACNPETVALTVNCASDPLPTSGLETYTYDLNRNLLTKTDANGVKITLSGYDAMNRPSSKSYTRNGAPDSTPAVP